MTKKNGKKISFDDYPTLNVVLGTVDNKDPKSVYVNMSAWAEPTSDRDIDYATVLSRINKQIRKILYIELNSEFFIPSKAIVDFDISESGIRYGKQSYTNLEITFFQTQNLRIQNLELQKKIRDVLDVVVGEIFDNSQHFNFSKTKQ